MFTVNLAGIRIRINNRYDFVENQCSDYIIPDEIFDFEVSVTEDDIENERSVNDPDMTTGYFESVCLYREIASRLPDHNALLFHCAALEYRGGAYCFTAKSGTGKTTHMKLWRRTFGEDVKIVNGDKPILRFSEDAITVCGTPWCGKENLQRNVCVPLKSICFIKQAPVNGIRKLSAHEALNKLLHQLYFPKERTAAEKTVELLGRLLSSIPIWELECDISEEAAIMSYNAMTKGENDESD